MVLAFKSPVEPPFKWKQLRMIGTGINSIYFLAKTSDRRSIAAKEIDYMTKEEKHDILNEVFKLKGLSHPNVVQHYGITKRNGSLYILIELVPGGKTVSSLLNKGPLLDSDVRNFTKQVLLGLEYLHNNRITHSRIKPANVLVDAKKLIKLADFSASKHKDLAMMNTRNLFHTLYWTAPEALLCDSKKAFPADIWSVGCTVIEMVTGKPPWSVEFPEPDGFLFDVVRKSAPHIPDHLSDDAKDFLSKCLNMDPDKRQTASELLQHPYITNECLETPLALENSSNQLSTSTLTLKNDITPVHELSFENKFDGSPGPQVIAV